MRQRILIVEDDKLQANILAGLLVSHGYDIGTAGNGLDAIDKLRTEFYDVALIDYRIPDVDGLAVARIVTSLLGPGVRPHLIALTAAPAQLREHEAQGTKVFDAVEQKPLSLPSLLATIQRCRDAAARLASTPQAETADPAVEAPATEKRAHVLIVDDDRQLTAILKSALHHSGFDVSTAHNGTDALGLVEANSYDAVVIDYQMPGMTGLAAAQSILGRIRRANPSRLVAFTATPEKLAERDRDSAALFDAVVGKSQGIPALLATIRQSVDYKAWRSVLYELGE